MRMISNKFNVLCCITLFPLLLGMDLAFLGPAEIIVPPPEVGERKWHISFSSGLYCLEKHKDSWNACFLRLLGCNLNMRGLTLLTSHSYNRHTTSFGQQLHCDGNGFPLQIKTIFLLARGCYLSFSLYVEVVIWEYRLRATKASSAGHGSEAESCIYQNVRVSVGAMGVGARCQAATGLILTFCYQSPRRYQAHIVPLQLGGPFYTMDVHEMLVAKQKMCKMQQEMPLILCLLHWWNPWLWFCMQLQDIYKQRNFMN